MTGTARPSIVPVADHALFVEFVGAPTALDRVSALDAALSCSGAHGLAEVVPAVSGVLVEFDPLVTDHATVERVVREALLAEQVPIPPTRHVVDVCYEPPFAPDLAEVAMSTGLALDQIGEIHSSVTYRVANHGFAPGYTYLVGTPTELALARRPAPGPPIPAGSVIVAGLQCLVIPVAMSTGWFAIGRSPLSVFDPNGDRPSPFDVGDIIEFRSIGADQMPDHHWRSAR